MKSLGHPRRVLLAALLALLALLRYAALWDHATRLPHPFESSLEDFFPDVVAVTGWLKNQPVDVVGVPGRHLDPYLFHRLCEMSYPIRCRPLSDFPPPPGRLVVVTTEGPLPRDELPPSVPVIRHGRLQVRRILESGGEP